VLLAGIPAQDSPAEMPLVGMKHSAEARLAPERRAKKIPDFMMCLFRGDELGGSQQDEDGRSLYISERVRE
jgi:hypothetical protein